MTIVSVFLSATVCPYAPHTSTTAVIIFARLAGDLETIAASSAYSMLHIVDVRRVSSPSLTAKVVELMLTRSASTWGPVYFLSCVCSSECTDCFQCLSLNERGTGRNEHGVVVKWTSACLWCLFSACSSSWYVLYLFVWFSFGLLSTRVTTGWIFEISLCEDSIQFKLKIQSTAVVASATST